MTGINKKTVDASGTGKDGNNAGSQKGQDSDDACRCKEASDMKPRQLLKLMMDDLAFWKKPRKK